MNVFLVLKASLALFVVLFLIALFMVATGHGDETPPAGYGVLAALAFGSALVCLVVLMWREMK